MGQIARIRGIHADPARQAFIAGMGYRAAKRRLRLIAEGIETPAELKALRALAIGYGQGYPLGRPQDGRAPGPWPTRSVLESQRRPASVGTPTLIGAARYAETTRLRPARLAMKSLASA